MLALIYRVLMQRKKALLINLLIAVGFGWMFVSFYNSIKDQTEELKSLIDVYPEELMKAFGVDTESFFTTFESFLGSEHFSILWPIILLVLIITYASATIAEEVDDGTIDVLLSLPLSRAKIFAAKYIGGLVLLLIFTVISVGSIIPLAEIYGVDHSVQKLVMIGVVGFLFGLAVLSLTMFISAMLSSRGLAGSIVSGIIIVMYALSIFAALNESAEKLKYLSYFYYFDYGKALIHGEISIVSLAVFITSSVVFTLAGAAWFTKRDIAA